MNKEKPHDGNSGMSIFKEYVGKIESEKILNRSIREVGGDINI